MNRKMLHNAFNDDSDDDLRFTDSEGDTDSDSDGYNSFSSSDFDPEVLRPQNSSNKLLTPRPSLTELRGILDNLDLDREFMLEELKMNLETDQQNDTRDDSPQKPSLVASRMSNSYHSDDAQSAPSITTKGTEPVETKEEETPKNQNKSKRRSIDHDHNSNESTQSTIGSTPPHDSNDVKSGAKRRGSKPVNRRRKSIKHTDKLHQQKVGRKWYINQFLCYKYLGKGSFGKVALAKDITSRTERKVAIKVINKSILKRKRILRKGKPPTDMLENIFREIAIMKALDHPNVLKLYEVIDDPSNDKLYMVLDYMDNGSVLGEQGAEAKCDPITDHELIRKYIREMILGLDYLHANDIIHGDIKPDNLLLSKRNQLKIADFGVSFMLDAETCPNSDGKISRSQGTPAFTAPETGSGSFMAYPTDVWAMGVTLYMMVTGICPFAGGSIPDTYDKIKKENPPIPQDIDPAMKDFMERILLKDPSKRITLKEAMVHSWITKGGSDPLAHPDEYNARKFEKRVSVTKMDVEYAVSLPSDTIQHLRRASMDKKSITSSLEQFSKNGDDQKDENLENDPNDDNRDDEIQSVFDLKGRARLSVDLEKMEQKEQEPWNEDENEEEEEMNQNHSESDGTLGQSPVNVKGKGIQSKKVTAATNVESKCVYIDCKSPNEQVGNSKSKQSTTNKLKATSSTTKSKAKSRSEKTLEDETTASSKSMGKGRRKKVSSNDTKEGTLKNGKVGKAGKSGKSNTKIRNGVSSKKIISVRTDGKIKDNVERSGNITPSFVKRKKRNSKELEKKSKAKSGKKKKAIPKGKGSSAPKSKKMKVNGVPKRT